MLDHILACLLLVVLPARALWRSRPTFVASEQKTTRYLISIGMIIGLLSALAADWILAGRPVQALGLAPPISRQALICLGLVGILLFVLRSLVGRHATDGRKDSDTARLTSLPDTPAEMRLFLLFVLTAGFGWEVLYRGFLIYYLRPYAGLWAAAAITVLAYSLAHGVKSPRQFSGSLATAIAFTLGYAATNNLWWLVLLHMGLPMLGLAARRKA